MGKDRSYVLVTAANNEAETIEHVIQSVIRQSIPPLRWVIVSDCSTDATDEIVASYSERYPFVRLLSLREPHPRNFQAQVNAINSGLKALQDLDYAYVGNLDADISFDPDYFERLIGHFEGDLALGLAGGFIWDKQPDGTFESRPRNTTRSVAHAVQLFRRDCFEALGGCYTPLPFGGPDTFAEVSARMHNYGVRSIPELKVLHYRPTGTAGGALKGCLRMGRMDYDLGYLPAYQFGKLIGRIGSRPVFIGSAVRMWGYLSAYLKGSKRSVPDEFVTYLRKEQREYLAGLVPGLLRRK